MNLLEMVRSMMSYSTLPVSFWGYALKIAMHILNLIPSKSIPNTLMELWSGRKPSMRYLHIWGCPTHVLKRKSDKLEAKTEVCMFLGYSNESKGYLFYNHKDNNVFVSTNAKFLEDDYVYLMRRKSEAFEKFKEFKAKVENQLDKHIMAIRSNRGGEYLLGDFKDYLTENGIISQLTAPRTPQQNGLVERRNKTLLDMVRSMMSYSTLPISFWGYALNTAMYF